MRWCQEERLGTGMRQESKYVKGGAASRLSHHPWCLSHHLWCLCGQEQSSKAADTSVWKVLASVIGLLWITLTKLEKVIQATFKQFTYPAPQVWHLNNQLSVMLDVGGLYGM